MKARSPFHWRRRVGMRDVDGLGVVWHGNYLGFCDEARAELLRAFGLPPGGFASLGLRPMVVDAYCQFLWPARHDEEIDILVRLRLGRGTRLHFDFAIQQAQGDRLLTLATTTMVLVRSAGDLVYLMPEELREPLARLLAAQQAEPPLPQPSRPRRAR
jgi:acyl-CoA thioester hydrolase